VPEKTDEYTIGVEEEYQVIDPKTRGLAACAERVLERARQALGDEEVAPELRASQIEVMSPVCRTLAEVRTELVRLRGALTQAAEEEGVRIAVASTHPFSHWRKQPLAPKERYRKLLESYQHLLVSSSRSASTCTLALRTERRRWR